MKWNEVPIDRHEFPRSREQTRVSSFWFSTIVTINKFFRVSSRFQFFFSSGWSSFFFFWCCSMFYHYYYYYRLTIFFKLLFPRIFFDFFSFYLLWSLVESINSVILFLWFFCNSLEIANSFRIHLYTHTRTHTRARAMTRYPPPLHTYTHTHILYTHARARARYTNTFTKRIKGNIFSIFRKRNLWCF